MTQLSLFSADLAEPRPSDLGGLLAAHGQAARSGAGVRLSILLAERWRGDALLRECRVRDIDAELVELTSPGAGLLDVTSPGADLAAPASGGSGRHGVGRNGFGARGTAGTDGVNGINGGGTGSTGSTGGTGLTGGTNSTPGTDDAGAGFGLTIPGSGPRRGQVLLRTGRIPELGALADDWTRGAVKAVPAGLTLGAGLLRCWTLAAGRRDEVGFLLGLDPHAPHTHEPLAATCSRAGVAGSLVGARAGGPAVRVVGHRRMMRLAELLGTPPPDAPAGAFPQPKR